MIEWILSSCVLILVVIAIRTLCRGRISLRLQYAMWALVLVRLLVPVSFGSTPISVANITYKPEQSVVQDDPATSAESPNSQGQPGEHMQLPQAHPNEDAPQQNVQTAPATDTRETDLPVLPVIWGVGAMAVAVLFLSSNLRFSGAVRRSRRSLDMQKDGISVYTTGIIDTPCLFGIFRPRIYVTSSVAEDETLLRHTLEHETTHRSHGDHIWAILRCVCLVIHWYNPLVWWAAFLSRRDGELACDEATIARLGEEERAQYGRTLIGMTCRKKANVLITATTMSTGSSGIKERIRLIAKKPKMAVYTLVLVLLVAFVAVGCTFTGPGGEDVPTVEPPTVTEPQQTEPQDTQPQETEPKGQEDPEPGVLYSKPFADKVCVVVQPTGVCSSGDVYKYLVPRQQDALLEYYTNALETAYPCTARDSSKLYTGWAVEYNGQRWRFTEDGMLYGTFSEDATLHCVDAKDASLVYAICEAAVESAGLSEPVRPREIVDIREAVLDWNGSHMVTDSRILQKIETMLQNSKQIDGAGCWFTATLELRLENGETKTIAMATDSCSTWMSEGVVYDYGQPDDDGNREFYSIFAPMVIRQKAAQSMDDAAWFMDSIDWGVYAQRFGEEEAFALIGKIGSWAADSSGDWSRYTSVLYWMNGLEGACADRYGAMLAKLYETKGSALAWACLGNAGEAEKQQCISLLAKHWNISAAEVQDKLQTLLLYA